MNRYRIIIFTFWVVLANCVANAKNYYFSISATDGNGEYRIHYNTSSQEFMVDRVGYTVALPFFLDILVGNTTSLIPSVKISGVFHTNASTSLDKSPELVFINEKNVPLFVIYVDKTPVGEGRGHDCYIAHADEKGKLKPLKCYYVSDELYKDWYELYLLSKPSKISFKQQATNKNTVTTNKSNENEITKYLQRAFGVIDPTTLENADVATVCNKIRAATKLNPVLEERTYGTKFKLSEPELKIKIAERNVSIADVECCDEGQYPDMDWSYLFFFDSDKKDAKSFLYYLKTLIESSGIVLPKDKNKYWEELYEGKMFLKGREVTIYCGLLKAGIKRNPIYSVSLSLRYYYEK